MILPAASIVALLFVLSCSFSGIEGLAAHGNLPALLCVLIMTACFVRFLGLLFGPQFGLQTLWTGLQAILHRPKEPQPDVANYFRYLALAVFAVGVISPLLLVPGIFFASLIGLPDAGYPDIGHRLLMLAILIFLYSGWLALLFFMPIAFRYSGGESDPKFRQYLIASALLGIVSLLAIIVGTCKVKQVPMGEVFQEVAGAVNIWNLHSLLLDFPSVIVVLATIGACRLGMGKVKNQHDWIPICIFIGILWTLHEMTLIQLDEIREIFVSGVIVSLLTTLYACIFALAAFARIFWIAIFTVLTLMFGAMTLMIVLLLLLWL